jgi:serine protease Do
MTTKYFFGLLAAICLSAVVVVAQDTPGSNDLDDVSDALAGLTAHQDDLQTISQFSLFDGGSYLGVYTEDINRSNMATYNLSQPRGVGITQVAKDSPAEKAGLRKGDVILRFDGENVTSVRKLNRLISEVAPDQTVRISVSRGGAEQELAATVSKRQGAFVTGFPKGDLSKVWKWETPSLENFSFSFGNSRRIGISTSELTKQLADFFGVPGGKGVLVTSVIEDDPAAKAGIKAGDVITSIDGEAVDSPGDISRIVNAKKEGEVTVTFVRNKTQQSVRLTPKEGAFAPKTIVRPQIGRRIVIPRVQFPDGPEVSIGVPDIQIPATVINIPMPNIQIPPAIVRIPMRSTRTPATVVNIPMPNIQIPTTIVDIPMPSIQIPVMPAINIQVPTVKVTPKAKAVVVQPM